MPKIVIKGGVWRNTEDEILKAAVGKYGLNQWARISSLLTRKTPKQVKARWYEWLDPGIKKTEWSKDEEEKLLHLAKLMPTQWRTIAPLVGRTPAQCLEHYEKLLDRAQGRDEEEGRSDDPRKLRAGEVDPNPETRPAKPDPVDMDDDEKEMLAEARARLANTQGKKAKRKAREKQLEEARRLASIQKRRELKAAGVELHHHKKRHGIDYNAEIPYHKQVPAGFYSTVEESDQAGRSTFKKAWLADLEGKRRDDKEEALRKKDLAKQKERERQGLPALGTKADDGEELPFARSKLALPAPQVQTSELEEIVKMGTPLTGSANDRTPLRTPMGSVPFLQTPKAVQSQIRSDLRAHLSALPKPSNEFEVVVPEDDDDDGKDEAAKATGEMALDAGDVAAERAAARAREEKRRLLERSQAIQRGLPRPTTINPLMAAVTAGQLTAQEAADQLLKEEILAILRHDALAHPVRGGPAVSSGAAFAPLEKFSDELMGEARLMLAEAVDDIQREIPPETMARLHAAVSADFVFLPTQNKYGKASAVPKAERIQSASNELEVHRANLSREAKKAAKLEGKIGVYVGGLATRASTLHKQLLDAFAKVDAASTELLSFQTLAGLERNGVESRIQSLQGAVTALSAREAELQAQFYDAQSELAALRRP